MRGRRYERGTYAAESTRVNGFDERTQKNPPDTSGKVHKKLLLWRATVIGLKLCCTWSVPGSGFRWSTHPIKTRSRKNKVGTSLMRAETIIRRSWCSLDKEKQSPSSAE